MQPGAQIAWSENGVDALANSGAAAGLANGCASGLLRPGLTPCRYGRDRPPWDARQPALVHIPAQRRLVWLKNLGMSEYAQRFAENGIGVAALPHLTDQRAGVVSAVSYPLQEGDRPAS
jgi:hypothetical protein